MEKNKNKKGIKTKSYLKARITLRTKIIIGSMTFFSAIASLVMIPSLNPFQSAAKFAREIKIINIEDQHFINEMTIASPEIKTKNVANQKTIFIKPKKIDNAQ